MRIIDGRGRWYKGNLHMHTTVSDGRLSPTEAIRLYREAGYDFIALTDHRLVNPTWIEEGERPLLVMSGSEYDTGHPKGSHSVYHILGIGMEHEPEIFYRSPYESKYPWPSPQEIVNAINAAGGAAILAHPAWSVMIPEEMFDLHGFAAAEIYNTYSGLPWMGDRADSSIYFDIWARGGRLVPATAADDSHHYTGEECRSYVMVNAGSLTQEAIVSAIRRGRFYASQGPRFRSLEVDDRTVTVTVEHGSEMAELSAEMTERGAGLAERDTGLAARDAGLAALSAEKASGGTITAVFLSNSPWGDDPIQRLGPENGYTASYHAGRQETYVRVMLIDTMGRKAWSSPFEV